MPAGARTRSAAIHGRRTMFPCRTRRPTLVRELFEELGVLRERRVGRAPSVLLPAGAPVPARPLAGRHRATDRGDRARSRRVPAFRRPRRTNFAPPASSPYRWSWAQSRRRSTNLSMEDWLSAGTFQLALSSLVHQLRLPRRLRRAGARHVRLGRHPLFRVPRTGRKGTAHLARGQRLDHAATARKACTATCVPAAWFIASRAKAASCACPRAIPTTSPIA